MATARGRVSVENFGTRVCEYFEYWEIIFTNDFPPRATKAYNFLRIKKLDGNFIFIVS